MKFVEKAIEKQEGAYTMEYATREFDYSCYVCASRGILKCDCTKCPIACAYKKAVLEIRKGMRKIPQKKSFYKDSNVRAYKERNGKVVLVLRDIENSTINISIK